MTELEYPNSYVVWDLETTGLDPATGHILEIAALVVKNGQVVEEYQTLLAHENLQVDPQAQAVHGISAEQCMTHGVPAVQALEKLADLIKDAPANITHNGFKFDAPFFLHELVRYGLVEPPDTARQSYLIEHLLMKNHIDTAMLYKAREIGARRGWNENFYDFAQRVADVRAYGVRFNVGACCDALGISREGVQQHRAMADVLLTNEIYKKLTQQE